VKLFIGREVIHSAGHNQKHFLADQVKKRTIIDYIHDRTKKKKTRMQLLKLSIEIYGTYMMKKKNELMKAKYKMKYLKKMLKKQS
jgi:hypothetical protein